MVIGAGSTFGRLVTLRTELAVKIALAFNNPVLYFPLKARSLLSQENGAVTLDSVVIAADEANGFKAEMLVLKIIKKIFPSIHPQLRAVYYRSSSDKIFAPALCMAKDLVVAENVTEGVLEVIEKNSVDLIIAVIKKERRLASKTMDLLKAVSCPVLLLPSK